MKGLDQRTRDTKTSCHGVRHPHDTVTSQKIEPAHAGDGIWDCGFRADERCGTGSFR